jgi:sec-independent protein translocase protein TatC
LTPTPDIFNMALMGVPLYLLYEIGLIGMHIWGK